MSMKQILLGFEVGTGKEVYMPPGHTNVTGLTQLSGKTTTLEALVDRGKITAIAFLTKRGEHGFTRSQNIRPYFREQRKGTLIDWRYVSAILEATMGERMKFERSWIINACKGAHSLQEVYKNIVEGQEDSRRSLDQSVFTNLAAYFEIILPQIDKYDFADSLSLSRGINVMNLIGMSEEMQQLVIESVISLVLSRLSDVVIVLPEAQKFIPQGRNTPVKQTAVRFIQEGAVLRNYLWIDSQVTTTVDKNLLKQCSNWIMGYQQERNEVANVRENVGKHNVTEEQIMTLKLGHFIALLQQKIYHVYVLPSGIEEDQGRDVAMGLLPPQAVKDMLRERRTNEQFRMALQNKLPAELPPNSEKAAREIAGLRQTISDLVRKEEEYQQKEAELERKIFDLKQQLEEAEQRVRATSNRVIESNKEKEELRLEKNRLMQSVERLGTEVSQFKAFKILLGQIIEPYVATDEELEKIRKDLEKLKRQKPSRIATPVSDVGIPWVDIWMSKLGTAEQKILRFMAEKFPLKMTKSQVALGLGLTAKGGYFNGAFNNLRKNKLIVPADGDNWKLSEGPP